MAVERTKEMVMSLDFGEPPHTKNGVLQAEMDRCFQDRIVLSSQKQNVLSLQFLVEVKISQLMRSSGWRNGRIGECMKHELHIPASIAERYNGGVTVVDLQKALCCTSQKRLISVICTLLRNVCKLKFIIAGGFPSHVVGVTRSFRDVDFFVPVTFADCTSYGFGQGMLQSIGDLLCKALPDISFRFEAVYGSVIVEQSILVMHVFCDYAEADIVFHICEKKSAAVEYYDNIVKFAHDTVGRFDLENAKTVMLPLSDSTQHFVAVHCGFRQVLSSLEGDIANEWLNEPEFYCEFFDWADGPEKKMIISLLRRLDCPVLVHLCESTSLLSLKSSFKRVVKYTKRTNRNYYNGLTSEEAARMYFVRIMNMWLCHNL
jgi:hypothetical protein